MKRILLLITISFMTLHTSISFAQTDANNFYKSSSVNLPFWGESEGEPRIKAIARQAAEQRYAEFSGGKTQYTVGTAYSVDENSHPIAKEFNDMNMISPRALLFVTGDKAHSKEFSEDVYKKASEPKELYYVKGAGHVDLLIPFDKLKAFFNEHLK